MNSIINLRKITVFTAIAIFATALLSGPLLLNAGTVFAKIYNNWDDCRDDHSQTWCKYYFQITGFDKCSNDASQGIGQSQSSRQNSQVVSGGDTINSGNNINIQRQNNEGNIALGQMGNGVCFNDASQGIGQSQSSRQNSQVVSGGDTINSGNNINIQRQNNEGNNALGQQ